MGYDLNSCFTTTYGRLCLGDARNLLKSLPDSSVDAVVTDPPWGVGYDEFDDPNVLFEVEDELWRVLKNDAWFIFYYTPKNLLHISRFRKFRYVWMIPYVFWSFGTVSRNPLGTQSSYSIIVVMAKGKPKIHLPRKDVIISSELPLVEEIIKEPQFKPTYTTMELLNMFTKLGDLVIDPFAGYGSIPFVCEVFGRRWIGFEIDPLKYSVARELLMRRRITNIAKMKKYMKEKLASHLDFESH